MANINNTKTDTNIQIQKLKDFIKTSKYIDINKQPLVCERFNLPYHKKLFQDEYRLRFYNYLLTNTTTVAVVSSVLGIPEKYLTQCKAYYEQKNMLKVVGLGVCPNTHSNNVQYLTTNVSNYTPTPHTTSNQLNLF